MTSISTDTRLDLTIPWQVSVASDAAPAQLAMRELQSHWQQISDHP